MRKLSIISSFLLLTHFSAQSWTQTGKFTPVERQGGDSFGFDLLLKNNTIFSSAHGNTLDSNNQNSIFKAGSLYILERQNNTWIKKIKLVPNDRASSDEFGRKLALDGNHLFVSAWGKRNGTNTSVGAVYLFDKDASGNWIQKQKINPPVIANTTYFGNRLSADSNVLAVGSAWTNTYVYELDNATQNFTFKQTLLFPNNGNTYESDVCVYGGKIIVGKKSQPVNGTANAGQVNIYKKNIATNVWEIAQTINSPTLGETNFGIKVYAKDDYLFVLASYFPSFVAIYKRNITSDMYEHLQTIGNGATYFGSSISMDNNVLAISAPGSSNGSVTGGGAVFIYALENNLWVEKQKIFNNDTHPYDGFGYGLSVDNGNVVVGAPDHDFDSSGNNINASAGAVYFFNDLSTLGTREVLSTDTYTLYPNPFVENISIQLGKQYDNLTADIYDMSGKKVYTNNFSKKQILELSLGSLVSGVYQITISSKEKMLINSRIIKK